MCTHFIFSWTMCMLFRILLGSLLSNNFYIFHSKFIWNIIRNIWKNFLNYWKPSLELGENSELFLSTKRISAAYALFHRYCGRGREMTLSKERGLCRCQSIQILQTSSKIAKLTDVLWCKVLIKRAEVLECVSSSDRSRSTRKPWVSSWLARWTEVLWGKVLIMLAEEIDIRAQVAGEESFSSSDFAEIRW